MITSTVLAAPETAPELVGAVLLLGGAGLIALAAVGLLRLPDAYHRVNAVAKAGSIGVVGVLLGVVCWTGEARTAIVLVPAMALQLFTAPLAGYATGRAAHRAGTPLAAGLLANELGPPGAPLPEEDEDGDKDGRRAAPDPPEGTDRP